jgi:hypothetical protein
MQHLFSLTNFVYQFQCDLPDALLTLDRYRLLKVVVGLQEPETERREDGFKISRQKC